MKLTGLWKKKNAKGEVYLQGSLGNCIIFINKNAFKREDSKDPDFYVNIMPRQKREEDGGENE